MLPLHTRIFEQLQFFNWNAVNQVFHFVFIKKRIRKQIAHSQNLAEKKNCLKFIKYAVNIEKRYLQFDTTQVHRESYFPQTLSIAVMHANSKMMWQNFFYNKQDLLDITVWKSNNLFWLETCIFQLVSIFALTTNDVFFLHAIKMRCKYLIKIHICLVAALFRFVPSEANEEQTICVALWSCKYSIAVTSSRSQASYCVCKASGLRLIRFACFELVLTCLKLSFHLV